jgi:hypothetical protein
MWRKVVLLLIVALVCADFTDHIYQKYEVVPVHVNKVGPYSNPTETYPYYHLPFCKPENPQHRHETFAEVRQLSTVVIS